MSDTKTLSVYDAKVDDYIAVFKTEPSKSLIDFMAELPAGGHVLDLGCGPGFSAANMANAGFQAQAWDMSQGMVDNAAQLDGVDAHLKGFDDLPGTPYFDGIWANFSLLHAARADLPRHIAAISTALKPGGIFHIGMKLGSGEHRDGIGRFYSYYSQDELETMLTQNGLTPSWSHTGEERGLAGSIDPFVLIRATKHG